MMPRGDVLFLRQLLNNTDCYSNILQGMVPECTLRAITLKWLNKAAGRVSESVQVVVVTADIPGEETVFLLSLSDWTRQQGVRVRVPGKREHSS